MFNKSIQICESEQFGNGWGFYVDIENQYPKFGFVNGKYPRNYYNCYNKIDEELEYYEYEYNKKKEEKSKQLENLNQVEEAHLIKKDSSPLLFHIISVTLFTLALSYYFIIVL